MNAFESVRLKPESMPPLVRALLYPANSPSARIPVSPTPRAGSRWRTGKPLHAGWWLTRLGYSKAEWRWWDGERWSLPSNSSNSAVDAAAVAQFASSTSFAMAWCMDWPEGARVLPGRDNGKMTRMKTLPLNPGAEAPQAAAR